MSDEGHIRDAWGNLPLQNQQDVLNGRLVRTVAPMKNMYVRHEDMPDLEPMDLIQFARGPFDTVIGCWGDTKIVVSSGGT